MAAYQYVYVMKNLTKAYPGGKEILKGLHLSFLPGVKIGVLGHNGAGKSTLLKIMAGIDKEYGGEAWAADGVKIGYLSQEPVLDETKDVLGNVMEGVGETKALLDRFEAVSARFGEELTDDEMNDLIAEQAALQEKIDHLDAWDLQRKVEIAMDALRCPPGDAAVDKLSGGEKRRIALCRLLLSRPDMLLLDEPTNHLDAESIAWLEKFLEEYPGTVVISHDRWFLDRIATHIIAFEGDSQVVYFEGNYGDYEADKRRRLGVEADQPHRLKYKPLARN